MMFVEMLRVAAQSIRANFFRAFLTMLGVIIGVAAVITMVALGTGAYDWRANNPNGSDHRQTYDPD